MKISDRIANVQSSPIRKLAPYAKAATAAGKKIYHLNIGQPDIATPECFMQAIREFDPATIAYGDSKGSDRLIEGIRKYYAGWGMDYDASDIFVTNGGSEALSFTMMTLCDPGDEIVVFEPYYANYAMFANILNLRLSPVATNVDEGYHLPNAATIEAAIGPKTRAILLTNPGNPTGVVYTEEEVQMLADIAKKHEIFIIADEVYREFVYGGQYKSFGTIPEIAQNVILIDSISKRYSACGARIGCIITKNKELAPQLLKCCQSRLCCPMLEQVGAASVYENTPMSYLEDVNKEYKKRRDTIAAALAKIPGLKASDPMGAFYVMVDLPVDDSEKFAIFMLEQFDVDGETTMIAPGNGFYITPGKGTTEARLAYVLKSEDLERAIYILGEGLKAYPGYTLK